MPTIEQIETVIADLADRFPKTFFVERRQRRPLKLGIHHDIAAALGDCKQLSPALNRYCGSADYLAALTPGADRIDLDGNAVGTVSDDDASTALQRLEARRPGRPVAGAAVLARLCELFPECFVMYEAKRKPLKLGIEADIIAAIGDVPGLHAAFDLYTGNATYLSGMRAGAGRIGLDGVVCGTVDEDKAAKAAARLAVIAPERKPKTKVEKTPTLVEPPKPKRLGLADLKAAAQRRKAQAAA